MISYYAPARMLHATAPSRLAKLDFGCAAHFVATTDMLSRFEIEHHSRSDIVHQTSLSLRAGRCQGAAFASRDIIDIARSLVRQGR
ncbi:hypothetical protein ASD02_29475 [Ensifer sp. Root1252]|nr:hypothetical protein ASD02_29475 [Ensifer sp. Root1252]KQW63863.1 hypothetical protein ASD03_35805 [Ensifer sp. Root127]